MKTWYEDLIWRLVAKTWQLTNNSQPEYYSSMLAEINWQMVSKCCLHLPHEWNWIKDEDANHIEEQVNQRALNCLFELVTTALSQSSQKWGEGCANIGAQKEWIHSFNLNQTNANHWSQSGCENGAWLKHNCCSSSKQNVPIAIQIVNNLVFEPWVQKPLHNISHGSCNKKNRAISWALMLFLFSYLEARNSIFWP